MPTFTPFDIQTHIIPLAAFAFSMAGSPGPNNVMLTASGTNYGFTRTIPHMLGIFLGLMLMFVSVAAGLGVIFEQWPIMYDVLKIAGSAFLLYMAWRIATASGGISEAKTNSKPLNVLEGLLFQFINPKAWLMTISAVSTFSIIGPNYWTSVLVICLVFAAVLTNTLPLWTTCGVLIRRWLSTPKALKRFNWAMGAMTAGAVVMILN